MQLARFNVVAECSFPTWPRRHLRSLFHSIPLICASNRFPWRILVKNRQRNRLEAMFPRDMHLVFWKEELRIKELAASISRPTCPIKHESSSIIQSVGNKYDVRYTWQTVNDISSFSLSLSLASARFSRLWIPFLNHLLDGYLCKIPLIIIFYPFFLFSITIL